MEEDITKQLEYTRSKLGMIATANAVSCARYFDHVMRILITIFLNWDLGTNGPKPGYRIFGRVTAFFGLQNLNRLLVICIVT
ncbi:hypothetical protein PHMEG_00030105 [Phytophthora megakarya]|uniref:Uncharacterized protein n=1 Tax=Phytophthora megakarya TaxID=4795 RepID=A0A225V158_9STRA|nr:hypothetical protein PHMEG_00030105 [Phytophthora megakarya]